MIGLKHQEVIRLLIENLLSDPGLATHGIERDEAVFQVQTLQQERDGGDLVGLMAHALLSKRDALLRGPGTDQMQGPSFAT